MGGETDDWPFSDAMMVMVSVVINYLCKETLMPSIDAANAASHVLMCDLTVYSDGEPTFDHCGNVGKKMASVVAKITRDNLSSETFLMAATICPTSLHQPEKHTQ